MNSYNTVSRFASEDKSEEWAETYHCLANFWVLPGEIGRSNKHKYSKGIPGRPVDTANNFNYGRKDYMDRFLKALIDEKGNFVIEFKDEFKGYFEALGIKVDKIDVNSFLEKQYINDWDMINFFSKIDENTNEFTKAVNGVIDSMEKNICKRASAVVKNEVICNKLSEYFFTSLKLI